MKIGTILLIVILVIGALMWGWSVAQDQTAPEAKNDALITRMKAIYDELQAINEEKGYYPLELSIGDVEYGVLIANEQGAVAWYLRGTLPEHAEESSGISQQGYSYRMITREGVEYYDICSDEVTCQLDF